MRIALCQLTPSTPTSCRLHSATSTRPALGVLDQRARGVFELLARRGLAAELQQQLAQRRSTTAGTSSSVAWRISIFGSRTLAAAPRLGSNRLHGALAHEASHDGAPAQLDRRGSSSTVHAPGSPLPVTRLRDGGHRGAGLQQDLLELLLRGRTASRSRRPRRSWWFAPPATASRSCGSRSTGRPCRPGRTSRSRRSRRRAPRARCRR